MLINELDAGANPRQGSVWMVGKYGKEKRALVCGSAPAVAQQSRREQCRNNHGSSIQTSLIRFPSLALYLLRELFLC